jgi:pyruvate dehydrogenase E2 component (dihydrolipoamide acetyltransferase)
MTASPPDQSAKAKGAITRVGLSRAQLVIARRMTQSRAAVPDFTLRLTVDMEETVRLRRRLAERALPIPTVNDFVVRAVAIALSEFPQANGAFVDGAVVLHERINIGVAVTAPGTLLVPTIFDANKKSVTEIGQEMRELSQRVRERTIRPTDLSNGTFTVSYLGMFGIDEFDAIINEPQAAILAVGRVSPAPAIVAGELVVRPLCRLSLSCDHRIIYGAEAAKFLGRLRDLLEQPALLERPRL